jgi:hypothetical protein
MTNTQALVGCILTAIVVALLLPLCALVLPVIVSIDLARRRFPWLQYIVTGDKP